MQTSTGWLTQWTVVNDATDDGGDARHIAVDFVVAQRSNVSMAVAALSGQAVRLSVNLAGVRGGGLEDASATIDPPWSAKKRGGFFFRAKLNYSQDLVRDLVGVTHAQSVDISLDLVQEELSVDVDRQAALDFVMGEGAHAG